MDDFEWDDDNVSHIWRHRVRPTDAEEAMLDPASVPFPASDVAGESREAIIGLTQAGRLLLVVYTVRGDRWRVVAVRRPRSDEARLYWRRQ